MGQVGRAMSVMNMLEAIRDAMGIALSADERVVIVGQDVGKLGGIFRATDGLSARFGDKRVIDMPLAEGVIIGSALGLALSGLKPVAEIQFLGFAEQAFHQIVQQVARIRYRSRGRFAASMVIRAPFGGGVRTPELHSDAIESQFAQAHGLKVIAPSNPYDAKGMLLAAIHDPDPVLFCESLHGYRFIKGEVPSGPYEVAIGKANVVREGKDVTLVAWSAAVSLAMRAAIVLSAEGIDAKVLDIRSLLPLDVEALVAAVQQTGRCVIVHEAPLTAGFGAEIVATIAKEAFYSLQAPIERVTAPDAPYPLGLAELMFIPNIDRVVSAARRTFEAQ
jgi:pyruvate dehydrogenase E1 component beta subunit